MGERHHIIHIIYVWWYDDSSKQSGRGQASISQRHLGSDVLTRICSEKKAKKITHHFPICVSSLLLPYPRQGSHRGISCQCIGLVGPTWSAVTVPSVNFAATRCILAKAIFSPSGFDPKRLWPVR